MQLGLVGLPNAGKTTLFNALTQAGGEVGKYPFTTTSSNVGISEVPDPRLDSIVEVIGPQRVVPASIKFLDVAGLIKGASKGEGLGNQFLGYIRDTDAIVHVVRCFDENIPLATEKIDPQEDMEVVNIELALKDLETIKKQIDKVSKHAKAGDKSAQRNLGILEKVEEALNEGRLLRTLGLENEERSFLSELSLLTLKPTIYVANISESDIGKEDNPLVLQVKKKAREEKAEVVEISAEIEAEIAELEKEERETFLKEMNLSELSFNKLAATCYKLLDLVTFFTILSDECRAWSIEGGTKAPQAAGRVHSDMERGFVKAEVVFWEDLVRDGSFSEAREKGHLLLEGKDYEVRDGDVIIFKFAV